MYYLIYMKTLYKLLLMWCKMLLDLQMLNLLCIPRINPSWDNV